MSEHEKTFRAAPSQRAVEHFLEVLAAVPSSYLGGYNEIDCEEFTDVIKVKEWLRLVASSGLLQSSDRK